MDKIGKFLAKVNDKLFERLTETVRDIRNGNIDHLDIKPLVGVKNAFRCRAGKIRILFRRTPQGNQVYDMDFRGQIYKK